jgi:hypothetical protein
MLKLKRLIEELSEHTYPVATLACERIVRDGYIKDKQKLERMYKELERKTTEFLQFVEFFDQEVLPLVPADDLAYIKECMTRTLTEDEKDE